MLRAFAMLEAVPFARFVGSLVLRQFGGILRLERDGQRHAVYFQDGNIVDADPARVEDTLCRVALEAGLIERDVVEEVLRRTVDAPTRSEKDLLVELGALGGDDLERALRMALTRRAVRIFALPGAAVSAEAVAHARLEGGPVEPRWSLYRGLRKHYDEHRHALEMRPLAGMAFELVIDPAAIFDVFGFSNQELIVLRSLVKRQYWELRDLVDDCIVVPRTTLLAVVHALWAFEYLETHPRRAAGTRPPVGAVRRTPVGSQPLEPVTWGPAPAPLTADAHFRRGEMALRRMSYSAAAQEFRAAVGLDASSPEYLAFLAWSRWCDVKEAAIDEVQSAFAKAIQLSGGRCIPAHYFCGLVHDARGDEEKAYRCFQRVISLDAAHADAVRRLNAIERRKALEQDVPDPQPKTD